MITFADPKKLKMESGYDYILLTDAGTWESFPGFAAKYCKQIGAKVADKVQGPDVHLWKIQYEGATLNFIYDDFPNGISIEPEDESGQLSIDKLYQIALKQSEPTGL